MIAALVLGLTLLPGPTVHSQDTPPPWSKPVNISKSAAQSNYPSIAADPAGGVHLIWTEETEQGGVLFYSHLQGNTWTAPIDVLVMPGGAPVTTPVMTADSQGTLHVVWVSWGSIYHSRAYAPVAGTAHGWSEPKPLAGAYYYISSPAIAIDQTDNTYVVYAEQIGTASGIYYMRSTNHGDTWQGPVTVYANTRKNRMVDRPRIACDPDGRLHVVWVEFNYPATFPPTGISYSYSTDGGARWSNPISLADGPYDYPGIATRAQNEVHVVWSGTSADRFKLHRWSPDGGRSWSNTWRNPDLGGYQGWPALVTDGSDNLHWLQVGTVVAVGDSLYYNVWNGQEWLPGEALLPPTAASQNAVNASAVVALGNELHVVVQSPLAGPKGDVQYDIFYLNRHLDARRWPARLLPTVTPTPTPTLTPTPAPQITATVSPSAALAATPTAIPNPASPAPITPPSLPSLDSTALIVIGMAPAVLLVVLAALVIVYRRRKANRDR